MTSNAHHGPVSAGAPGAERRVGWVDLGIAAVAALILYAIGIAIIWAVPDDAPIAAGLTQYAVSGLAPMGAFLVVLLLRVKDPRALGIRRVGFKWIAAGVGLGVVAIVLAVVSTLIVVAITGTRSDLQGDYQAAAAGGILAAIATLALGAILTPIGEELLFRGVLYSGLARYGAWVSVIVSAAVFAVAHGFNYILPIAFIVGVFAALLMRRTGSVWPGVAVHVTNNAYAVGAAALIPLFS